MTAPCWRNRRARRKKVSVRPPAGQCALTQITCSHSETWSPGFGRRGVRRSLSWIWRGRSGSLEKELPGPVGDHLHPLPGSFQAPWVPGLSALGFGGPAGQRAPLINASICCMHCYSLDSQEDARKMPGRCQAQLCPPVQTGWVFRDTRAPTRGSVGDHPLQ